MMLEEVQARLKKEKISTEEQLWQLNSLYILLDLHKDDFCKIIDAVGLETLIKKQSHYERIDKAERELSAKERYQNAKRHLVELQSEIKDLEQIINNYEGEVK